MQPKAKTKYLKKCKKKLVVFYPKEMDLLEYANKINFQGAVKGFLRSELDKENKKGGK